MEQGYNPNTLCNRSYAFSPFFCSLSFWQPVEAAIPPHPFLRRLFLTPHQPLHPLPPPFSLPLHLHLSRLPHGLTVKGSAWSSTSPSYLATRPLLARNWQPLINSE